MALIHFGRGRFVGGVPVLLLSLMASSQVLADDELLWIKPGDGYVADMVASPTSNVLYASAPFSDHIKRWDIASQTFSSWFTTSGDITRVDISSDGRTVASVGSDTLSYRSAATGRLLATFYLGSSLQSIDYASNGTFLLVSLGSSYPTVVMKAPGTNTTLRSYSGFYIYGLNDLVISPDSRTFVVAGQTNLTFWNVASTVPYKTFPEGAFSADISADGRLLVTGHARGKVVVWDYSSLTPVKVLYGDRNAEVKKVAIDDVAGHVLALQSTGFQFGQDHLFAWSYPTFNLQFMTDVGDIATALAVPASGDVVFTSSWFGGTLAFNRFNGAPYAALTPNRGWPWHVRFALGGSHLLSSSQDPNDYRAVNASTGSQVWTVRLEAQQAAPLSVSADGSRIGAADNSGVKILDAATGQTLQAVPHTKPIRSVALSPNPDIIAFGEEWPSHPPTIYARSLTSGQLAQIPLVNNIDKGIEFTPNGNRLVASLSSGWIHVYRTDNWQLSASARFDIQISGGCEFALSPDSSVVAVMSRQLPFEGIKLARVSDLSEVSRIPLQFATDLEFSEDGQVLWLAGDRIYAYRVADGQLLYASSHPEIRRIGRIAVAPASGNIAFYRRDGTQGILRNPLQ